MPSSRCIAISSSRRMQAKGPPARRPQTRRKDLSMIVPRNESYRSNRGNQRLLSVRPEGIPVELKRRPQWVNFEAVQKPDGRLDKIPYTPGTKRKASTTDLT